MTDKSCAYTHRVHTNTNAEAKTVSLVFDRLCGGDDGVQCRHVDRNGVKVGEDQFARNPGEGVTFDLNPGHGINIHCNGGDQPCSYRVIEA